MISLRLARSTTRSSADHRHGPLWRPYGHIRQSELVPRQIRLPLGAITRPASPTPAPLLRALLSRPRAFNGTRVVPHPIPCPLWPRLALYLHVRKALHYARLAPDLAVVPELADEEYEVHQTRNYLACDPNAQALLRLRESDEYVSPGACAPDERHNRNDEGEHRPRVPDAG